MTQRGSGWRRIWRKNDENDAKMTPDQNLYKPLQILNLKVFLTA